MTNWVEEHCSHEPCALEVIGNEMYAERRNIRVNEEGGYICEVRHITFGEYNLINEIEEKVEALAEYMGLKLKQIDERQYEVTKAEVESGDYLDPIHFVAPMEVTFGLWYYTDDKELPRECIRNGYAETFDDRLIFDWV